MSISYLANQYFVNPNVYVFNNKNKKTIQKNNKFMKIGIKYGILLIKDNFSLFIKIYINYPAHINQIQNNSKKLDYIDLLYFYVFLYIENRINNSKIYSIHSKILLRMLFLRIATVQNSMINVNHGIENDKTVNYY